MIFDFEKDFAKAIAKKSFQRLKSAFAMFEI